MRKLSAIVDPTAARGVWKVTVTDFDTNETNTIMVNAATEKDAAFRGMEMEENIHNIAEKISAQLGEMVNADQISPPEVVLGAMRGAIAFWIACIQDGARTDALSALRQGLNDEIDNMVRGIANGMVPA